VRRAAAGGPPGGGAAGLGLLGGSASAAVRTPTAQNPSLQCRPLAEPRRPTAGVAAPGRLGYIRLGTFNGNTAGATQEAIEDLKKAGVDGYVLDIRSNGGGLFPAGAGRGQSGASPGAVGGRPSGG
jgi:hypothetical protein